MRTNGGDSINSTAGMEIEREMKIGKCRQLLTQIIKRPETPSKPFQGHTKPSTCIKRWYTKDKLFDGKFSASGASTPLSPHTPSFVGSTLRNQNSTAMKEPSVDQKQRRHSNLARELDFNTDESIMYISSPALSAQSSVVLTDSIFLDDNPQMSRYEQDFEELELIGKGNSGTVFRCQHRCDGLYYAVKKIKFNISCPLAKNEGLREATALAASSMIDDNFYIIRYFTVWIEHDLLYISMELCECSLLKFIEREGEVAELLVRRVMRDVCKGLSILHRKNIVHLDIKTENILFSFSHRFKLSDLGLAQLTTNLNHNTEISEGDSRYLAPEMLDIIEDNAETIPDLTKADIFSLGATIYEIMTGKELPKNGEEWHHIRSGNLTIEGPYSIELKSVVKSMLSRDPARRPSARELLDDFLLSPTKQELKRLKLYNAYLESQLAQRQATMPHPTKRCREA